MDYTVEIARMVTDIEKRIKSGTKQLEHMPEGKLSYRKRNGSQILVADSGVNGTRNRRSLTKEPDYAVLLLRRELLESELVALKRELEVLKQVQMRATGFDLNEQIRTIRARIPILTDEIVQKALRDPDWDEWQSAAYEKSDYRSQELRHFTSKGLKVRTKSEALIAESLYNYKQVFRYEQVIHLGTSTLVPDFTIRRSDGKLFIWEHEGLTNNQDYLNRQLRKAQMYASVGFVPWDNFIVTYDDPSGNIDLRIVDSEIRNKLILK